MPMLDIALRREVQHYLKENNASKEERTTISQIRGFTPLKAAS